MYEHENKVHSNIMVQVVDDMK